MTHVVAIGDRDDRSLSRVVKCLESGGVSIGWLPLHCDDHGYDLELTPQSVSLAGNGFVLDDDALLDTRILLYRRWRQRDAAPVVSTIQEPEFRDFAEREWSAAIDLLLLRIERERPLLRWAERPSTTPITRSRLALIDYASACGLAVPDWRVLTDLSSVADGEGALVAKSVDRDERIAPGRYFSTATVEPAMLSSATDAPPTPTHLQKLVERSCEYRVFYVFGRVLTVAQHTTDAEVDIRHVKQENIELREEEIPADCAASIGRFCDQLGLGLCAFDLIRDGDSLWLVDVTPNGSWDHLETEADPWLSNRIAAAVTEGLD